MGDLEKVVRDLVVKVMREELPRMLAESLVSARLSPLAARCRYSDHLGTS